MFEYTPANMVDKTWEPVFKVGDRVEKIKGYSFPGTIVSVFETTTGKTRLVVEMEGYGLLHIFSEKDLKHR